MKKHGFRNILAAAAAAIALFCGESAGYDNKYLTHVKAESAEVDVSAGRRAEISWRLHAGGAMDLMICDMDGAVVRHLLAREQKNSGVHRAFWDGLDDQGAPVPGGAYFPMLRLVSRHKGLEFYNPTAVPWGGRLPADDPIYDADAGQITFRLGRPALCQLRVGEAEGGPSYGTLLRWQARAAGDHALPWDGMDAQQVHPVHRRDKFRIVFDTIELPPNTLMVAGSATARRPAMPAQERMAVQPPTGAGVYIHSLHSRHICRDPGVDAEIQSGLSGFEEGIAVFDDFVRLAVTTAHADRARILERMNAEVYLFVDGVFHSEVKAPRLPAEVELATKGLGPGRHFLTINLRDMEDHVGAMTIAFIKK